MKSTLLFSLLSLVLLSACTPSSSTNTTTTPSSPTVMIEAPTYGSGTHTLEYFADFQCPACINFSSALLPIFEEFAASGKLTIIYKQFPLTNIHKNAYRDSIAALCAAEQGQYMSYKKALIALEKSKAGASVSDSDRVNIAKDIAGMNTDTLAQCLKDDRYKSSVDRDIAEGDAKRVNATPTLLFDGTKLDLSIFRDAAMLKDQMERILSK